MMKLTLFNHGVEIKLCHKLCPLNIKKTLEIKNKVIKIKKTRVISIEICYSSSSSFQQMNFIASWKFERKDNKKKL